MIEIEGPDGSVYEFPDDTPRDVIKGAMSKRFGSPTSKSEAPKKEETPWYKTAAKAFAYGVADTARQDAALSTKSGLDGSIPSAIQQKVSSMAGLEGYEPGAKIAWDSNKPISERLSAVPQAVLESIPGLAQDAVAGLGNPWGFMAAHAARITPDTIDSVRAADGVAPNTELTTGQKARVAASVGADAILNRLGMKATFGNAGIKEVGSKAIPEIAKSLAKTGAIDTALTEGGIAADKAIVEGQAPSLNDLAVGAVMGGGSGVAGRGLPSLKEGLTAFNYRGLNDLPERSVIATAQSLDKAQKGNPKADPLKGAAATLDRHIKNFGIEKENKQLIADTGIQADLNLLTDALKRGETMDPEVFSRVQESVDGIDAANPLIQSLTDRNTFNQIKTQYFNEGLSDTPLAKAADPNSKGFNPLRIADYHLIGKLMHGAKIGAAEKGLAAVQAGLNAIPKAVDHLTGASDPTKVLIDKFAGRDLPAGAPSMPYVSPVLAAKAQQKADAQAAREKARADAIAARENAAKTKAFQKKTNDTLGLLDRLEAEDAAKAQGRINDLQKVVGKLDDPYMPQYERFGRDLGVEANLPPNPQYGSSSPVDVKRMAFDAKLLRKLKNTTGEDLAQMNKFDNDTVTSPLDIPADDPMRTVLMERFLQHKLGNSDEAQKAATRAEMAQEQAMIDAGFNPNSLPTPDWTPLNRKPINRETAFPEPKLLEKPRLVPRLPRVPMEKQAELAKRATFLSKVKEVAADRAGKPAEKPKPKKATKVADEAPAFSVAFAEAPKKPDVVTREMGRLRTKITAHPEKIRNKLEDGSPDYESHFRGVNERFLQKEKAIDALKADAPQSIHSKLDAFEKSIKAQGMGKETAAAEFERILEKGRLSEKRKDILRQTYKKTALSKVKHWETSARPK